MPMAQPSPHYGLASLARVDLVGRDADLATLHGKLQGPAPVAIAAVAGMGGVGKTALAQHYVQTHLDDYGGGCWYFKLNNQNLVEVVVRAAGTYGWQLPESLTSGPTMDLRQVVNWCYGQWQRQFPGPKLLVIDDVPTYSAVKDYLPALPHNEGIAVLMTSRQRFQPPVDRLDLGVLALPDALDLLTQLVGDADRVQRQRAEAEALCQWVGRLPLGIELVARYLAVHPNLAFTTLHQRLEQKQLQARALRQDPPAEMAYELPLEAAFLLSWAELDEPTQTLAATLALLAAAPIPAALVAAVLPDWDEEDREEALDEHLAYRNLVQTNPDGSYQLHPLVREFVQGRLREELAAQEPGCARAVARAIVEIAKTVPQTVTVTQQQRLAPAVPHLEAVATALLPTLAADALDESTDYLWPYTGLGRLAESQSLWPGAEQWRKDGLHLAEQRFGPDHPHTATSLNNLAGLYQSMGRFGDAEPLFSRALTIREAQLGPDHPDTAGSLNNLAGLYQSMGRFGDAEPLFSSALTIREAQLGPDHPDTATSLNNLAALYKSMGRFGDAEPLYSRALTIYEVQLGPDHPHTATSLNNLAALYKSMGRFGDAEPLYSRALTIREAQLGPDHPHTASSLNNLAALYFATQRYSEAEPLLTRALAISAAQLGENHPAVALRQLSLAILYSTLHRYADAEPLYVQAITTFLQTLGQDHPDTQRAIQAFAEYLTQVIAAHQTGVLSDHPFTQALLGQLGQP